MKHYYPAIFERAEDIGGFVVTVPDIKGCVTQGENLLDATIQTVDAIDCMLSGTAEKDFPKPSDVKKYFAEYPGAIINIVEYKV